MSQYIKREDALHELSTAPFWDDVSEAERGVARAKARYVLNAIPAADVEPVVRCRDCITARKSGNDEYDCMNTLSTHNGDWYCPNGIRGAHGKERER